MEIIVTENDSSSRERSPLTVKIPLKEGDFKK